MAIILIFIFGVYFISILTLLYGWEKALTKPIPLSSSLKTISVVVPIRNEEQNIEKLLNSLVALHYPKEKLQIILVNDHSTDRSVQLISKFLTENILLINLESARSGKKAALSKGIEHSTPEIIVTTDADCIQHQDWLLSINDFFEGDNIQMVVGPVAIDPTTSWFAKLQAIEFSSLIGSGAAMLHWGIPAMANGANLAFRKSAFVSVGGYEGNQHIPSGDDEYLLKKVFEKFPEGVVFNNKPASVVRTLPMNSFSSFINQRLRWAGKWKYQDDWKVKAAAVAVFCFQAFMLVIYVLAIVNRHELAAILILAKVGLEGVFLFRVCQFLGVRFSLLPFVGLQLVYPFYVVFTAMASFLVMPIWKDRKL
jgi:poly-beta-1,6-N-acetyl-D-glucosamine synthase